MRSSKIFFIFITLAIFGFFLYIPKIYQGYNTLKRLNNELELTKKQTEKLKDEIAYLKSEVDNFDDLYHIEKFARNNLDMKKKGETIYRVIYEEEKK